MRNRTLCVHAPSNTGLATMRPTLAAAAALLALLALLQGPAAAATFCSRKGNIAASGKCSTKYHVCARKGAKPTSTRTCPRGKHFNAASSKCEVRPACNPKQPGGTMLGGSAIDSGYQNGTYPYPGTAGTSGGGKYCCFNKNAYVNNGRYVREKECTMPKSTVDKAEGLMAKEMDKANPDWEFVTEKVYFGIGNKYLYPEMKSCCDPGWCYNCDRIIAPCTDAERMAGNGGDFPF